MLKKKNTIATLLVLSFIAFTISLYSQDIKDFKILEYEFEPRSYIYMRNNDVFVPAKYNLVLNFAANNDSTYYIDLNDSFNIINKSLLKTSFYNAKYYNGKIYCASYYYVSKVAPIKIFFDYQYGIIFEKEMPLKDTIIQGISTAHNKRNFYVDTADKYLYTYSDNVYADTTAALVLVYGLGTRGVIEKIDLKTGKSESHLWCPYSQSNTFLGNDKRLVWLAENWNPNQSIPVDYFSFKGISYIALKGNFSNENIKTDTNWMFIKSELDKEYESHPKLDTMITRYIGSVGLKNNNLFVMLRDKWIDTISAKQKTRPVSIPAPLLKNFKYYESTIYTFDFNTMAWDTLNLSEGIKLLKQPQSWCVENRFIGNTNSLIVPEADTLKYGNKNDDDINLILYSTLNPHSDINRHGIYKWSDNELAVAFQLKSVVQITSFLENANRIFLIYNFDTKEWRKFEIPGSIITPFLSQKRIVDWNGYKYFYVVSANENDTLYQNKLIKYDPGVGIKETNDGIFMEVGFRKVYPNPAIRTATAEIMCYVRDFSKLDVGLYNMLGEKILDLNNDYEYNDATKTIYMTIKLPSQYNDGIYYLNIRNGSERRTRGIFFGQ